MLTGTKHVTALSFAEQCIGISRMEHSQSTGVRTLSFTAFNYGPPIDNPAEKTDKLRSIGQQSGESVESVLEKKRKATVRRISRKRMFKHGMKE